MIRSITLCNFRSFGAPVTVPLSPITVLVGPNNSGKSCFMSVGEIVALGRQHIGAKDLPDGMRHRPPHDEQGIQIEWKTDSDDRVRVYLGSSDADWWTILLNDRDTWPEEKMKQCTRLLASSRVVKLSIDALRAEAQLRHQPVMQRDGRDLAAVVNDWRNSDTARAHALDEFVRRCAPDVAEVLAPPSAKPGHCALRIRQIDGQSFDADLISDGILYFIGLAASVMDVGKDSLVFIEEPENGIHPPAIHELVELLRRMRR